ncbi:MAG TPA: hypothetical protein VHM24_11215, partial [Gemmatimonadaceae bacterium]|nr:hypothetical protein [Gemmatimonadaceae bacterium]
MLAEKVAVLAYLELSEDIDARETVVAAGSLASAVLGAVFWVSRIGFPNPAWPVLQVVGLAMFAIATPLWLMHAARVQRIGLGQWWTSHPALMLFCLGVMALVG